MPRGKGFRRSQAAKRKMVERHSEVLGHQHAPTDSSARKCGLFSTSCVLHVFFMITLDVVMLN